MAKKSKNIKEEVKQENIKTETETRTLFHKFTEEDINVVNEKIAELSAKKNEFDEKRKYTSDIVKGCDAEIKMVIKSKEEGGEDRQMECPVEINYTTGKSIVKHPETGEILEERNLSSDERTPDLFEGEQQGSENGDGEEQQEELPGDEEEEECA